MKRVTSLWNLVPLRLFIGFFFLKAGLEKANLPFLSGRVLGTIFEGWFAKPGMPSFYRSFLEVAVLGHLTLFAVLVVVGEISVGVTLLLGLGVRVSACVGVFMCTNYFFATMHTGPSSIGVNLAFIFSCLTMVLAGPGKALGLDALLSTKKRLGWL